MRRIHALTALALSGALVTTTACTTDPYTGQQRISRTAIGAVLGAGAGYLLGDVIGGRHDRGEKLIGAGIGALAGGAAGVYMDRQERDLRRQTAGTGVDVIRQGDELLLRMPSGITFDTDQYDIKPQFRSTLDEVARTLGTYNQTYIDVLGHTDTTGSAEHNQALSERRAQSVANYLVAHGIQRVRIATRGYGETQPLYMPDDTEAKRAANRRVEIKLVPVQATDVR
jgi:outer membrane protein OmpA-like peptidoglycan-associated protein